MHASVTSSCVARLKIKINPCVAWNVYTLKRNTSYVVLYLLVIIFSDSQINHRVSHTQDYHRYLDNEGRLKGTPVSFGRLVVSDWFIFVVNMSDSCCLRNCSLFNGRLGRFVLLREGAYILSITISRRGWMPLPGLRLRSRVRSTSLCNIVFFTQLISTPDVHS